MRGYGASKWQILAIVGGSTGAVFNRHLPVHLAILGTAGLDLTITRATSFAAAVRDAMLAGAAAGAMGSLTSLVRGRPSQNLG